MWVKCDNKSVKTLLLISFLNIFSCAAEEIAISSNYKKYETRPEVKILHGPLRGVEMFTQYGRRIFGFKGIPYAQPPVGNLRFRAPVPPRIWKKIRDAGGDSSPCPQLNNDGEFLGNEDCLYLNVYTPKLPARNNSSLLPVMFYVFGGGFKRGSNHPSDWNPLFILEKDVVLVIPNYRTGVLGYLSTGDEASPGNYGLKDLRRALQWNKNNIRYFGGDPQRVTFVGGSSGAMCVELLSLSDTTKGLFQRYIGQSGPAISPQAQHSKKLSASRTNRLAKHFGCPTENSQALVDCLRTLSSSELVQTEHVFYLWNKFPAHIWAPTVEPDVKGAVLTETTANLFAEGKIRDLPRLYSLTTDEGVIYRKMLQDPQVVEGLLKNLDLVLPSVLMYEDSVDNVTAYTEALKSYYLNDLTADKKLLLHNLTTLNGDAIFTYPVYKQLQHLLVHSKSPQYLCSFEYRGTLSQAYTPDHGFVINNVSVHGDECVYLFKSPPGLNGPPDYEMSENDYRVVDVMVQLWTSFVINGTPTLSNRKNSLIWEPYSSERRNFLRIGRGSEVSVEVGDRLTFEDRLEFWDKLYVKFYRANGRSKD